MVKPCILHLYHDVTEPDVNNDYSRKIFYHCEIRSEDEPTVIWVVNRTVIDERYGIFCKKMRRRSNGNYLATLEDKNAKNGHAGVYEIIVKNADGATGANLDVRIYGFGQPLADGKPFMMRNEEGYRVLGIKLKQVTDYKYCYTWYKDDLRIRAEDRQHDIKYYHPAFCGHYVFLLIKKPERYVSGVYKVVVKGPTGELNATYTLVNEIRPPTLWKEPRIFAQFAIENSIDRMEKMHVRISVPFTSWSSNHYVRWSINEPMSTRQAGRECHEEAIEAVGWNKFIAYLQVKLTCGKDEYLRRYRCEIFDEGGKCEAFANVKVKSIDEQLTARPREEHSKCEKFTKTGDCEFFEIKGIGSFKP